MKYRKALNLLLLVLLFYFPIKYIITKNEVILFYGLITFFLSTFISIIIYIIIFFDFRFKLRYVSLEEVSEETKVKILKEQQQENKEFEKNNNTKQFLYNLIYKQIYSIAFIEMIIIIHFFIKDKSLLNNVLIYTFPAFLALIISIFNIFKIIIKKY